MPVSLAVLRSALLEAPFQAMTELRICVPAHEVVDLQALAASFPELGPVLPVIAAVGADVFIFRHQVSASGLPWAEAEIDLLLDASAQERAIDWLVARGAARRTHVAPHVLDATDSRVGFIAYPTGSEPQSFVIKSHHRVDPER